MHKLPEQQWQKKVKHLKFINVPHTRDQHHWHITYTPHGQRRLGKPSGASCRHKRIESL